MSDVMGEIIEEWWAMGRQMGARMSDEKLLKECVEYSNGKSARSHWVVRGVFYELALRQVKHAIKAESEADRVEEGDQPS